MKKIFYIIICACLLVLSCSSKEEVKSSESTVMIDAFNRKIQIPDNPKRVVIGDHYWEAFMVGGNDVFENVVGWSATTWVKWRNSIYKEFAQVVPRLSELVDVGLTFDKTFDIEKFLSLNPDLLILPIYQYGALDDGTKEAIEIAGIPIVVIDFSTGTQALHNRSIEILGEIFNQKERAQTINSIYNMYLETIEKRLSTHSEASPTVYLEKGSTGPAVYDETWGSSNWAPVLTRAGGINISKKIINGVGNADNEFILSENPDFIFFSGSTWPLKNDAIQLGFDIDKSVTKKTAMRYIDEREGWHYLSAVKNENVFMMHHGFIRSILDFIPTIYVAEKLYPELFSDLNSEDIAVQFFNDYLPVEFHGSWLCSLYED